MKLSRKFLFSTTALAIIPAMTLVFVADASAATKTKTKAKEKTVATKPATSESTPVAPAASTNNFFNDFPEGSLGYAIASGKPWVNIRYRYEYVSQDGFSEDAYASTIRTKLGYKTALWNGFQVAVEGENVAVIGADHYNSTVNGKTTFPTVSDPDDTDLNQLYISYQGLAKTNITVGRQLINLDNQRFIGAVDWRQNDQTFDAATISSQIIDKANLFYGYVRKVNRITGPSATNGAYESDSHLINASYEFDPALKIAAYDYALDFDDAASSSSNTYGARLTGKYALNSDFSLVYAGEYARQSDYGSNTANYDENYYLIEPGVSWNGFTAKAGYEVLEGNGTSAFQTPLDTLHAFNGWADKFLTTPANGLEDRYGSLAYKVPFGDSWVKGTDLVVAYHDFQAEHTGADYGTEWNASIQQTFYDRVTLGLKFADYNADTFGADTTKVITTVQFKY